MSVDIQKTVQDLAQRTGQDAAAELKDLLEDTSRLPYLDALITKYAKHRGMALAATTAQEVEFWTKEAAHVEQTMEHVLVQEKIVADAKMAAFLKRTIMAIVSAFTTVLKELVAMAVSGAVKGLTGGAGGAIGDALGEVVGDALAPK